MFQGKKAAWSFEEVGKYILVIMVLFALFLVFTGNFNPLSQKLSGITDSVLGFQGFGLDELTSAEKEQLKEAAPEDYVDKVIDQAKSLIQEEKYDAAKTLVEDTKKELATTISPAQLASLDVLLKSIAMKKQQQPWLKELANIEDRFSLHKNDPSQLKGLLEEVIAFKKGKLGEARDKAGLLQNSIEDALGIERTPESLEDLESLYGSLIAGNIPDGEDPYEYHRDLARAFRDTRKTESIDSFVSLYRRAEKIASLDSDDYSAYQSVRELADALQDHALYAAAAYEYESILADGDLYAAASSEIEDVKNELVALAKRGYVSEIKWDLAVKVKLIDEELLFIPDDEAWVTWPVQLNEFSSIFNDLTFPDIQVGQGGATFLTLSQNVPFMDFPRTQDNTITKGTVSPIPITVIFPFALSAWDLDKVRPETGGDDFDVISDSDSILVTLRFFDSTGGLICNIANRYSVSQMNSYRGLRTNLFANNMERCFSSGPTAEFAYLKPSLFFSTLTIDRFDRASGELVFGLEPAYPFDVAEYNALSA